MDGLASTLILQLKSAWNKTEERITPERLVAYHGQTLPS
jgi:hypothetical protein